jgi:hypothetical protein
MLGFDNTSELYLVEHMMQKYHAQYLGYPQSHPEVSLYQNKKGNDRTTFAVGDDNNYALGQNCVQALDNYNKRIVYKGFEISKIQQTHR